MGAAVGTAIGAASLVAAVRRRYVVVTVNGASMYPTFADGDRVLVRRNAVRPPRRGEVVVLQPPPAETDRDASQPLDSTRGGWNIKRIVAAPGDPLPQAAATACGQAPGTPVPAGRFVVFGEAPISYDSRAWGFLPADRLLGVVLRRLSPRTR